MELATKESFPLFIISLYFSFTVLFFFYQKRKEKLSWFSTLSFIFLHFFTQAKKSCIHFLPPSFSFICILSGFCYNFILCSFFLFFFFVKSNPENFYCLVFLPRRRMISKSYDNYPVWFIQLPFYFPFYFSLNRIYN